MESDAVRRGRVRPDEHGKDVLHHLDRQVADVLLVARPEPFVGRGRLGEARAAETHVHAVVGEAGTRRVRQRDETAHDQSRFTQDRHRVETAAAQHLMAEQHVLVLLEAAIPTRQARAAKQLAKVRVRHAVVEPPQALRRIRREVDDRVLPRLLHPERGVRIGEKQVAKQRPLGGFGGDRSAAPTVRVEVDEVKRRGLRRRVVAREQLHHLGRDAMQLGRPVVPFAEEVREAQLEQIRDRHVHHLLAVGVTAEEAVRVGAQRSGRLPLVGAQIVEQRRAGVRVETPVRDANPAVFPDAFAVFAEETLDPRDRLAGRLVTANALRGVLVVARFADDAG